jgi:uncharacterized membrane protein
MSLIATENGKEKFQVERIAFFSDAIFAIAITLLTIEIHPPKVTQEMTEAEVLRELKHLIPEFLGLLMSYIFIAVFWIRHHRVFKYIHTYNPKLLAINFIFLFTIILYPFSMSFLFNSYMEKAISKTQVVIYLMNPLLSSLSLLGLLYFIKEVSMSEKDKNLLNIVRLWLLCLSFFLAIVFVIIFPKNYSTYCYLFLVPNILWRLRRKKQTLKK